MNAIEVDNVSKRYNIGRAAPRYQTLRDTLAESALGPWRKLKGLLAGQAQSAANLTEPLWALDGVSLQVAEGDVVGLVGRNGAGKTTLLKILSRITFPTSGEVRMRGRVGSLLEVGTGFHPELTGRENIYLSGAILGMHRPEIEARFDDIVRFAEVDRFLETPVKHYSSGMEVRLAFAVAAHLEPEILVVDEVLAVGDLKFQQKCLGKMQEKSREGRTVIFVSHNMATIRGLCNRAVWLDGGRVVEDGDVDSVVHQYLAAQGAGAADLTTVSSREGTGRVRFTSFELLNAADRPASQFCSGDRVVLRLGYEARDNLTVHVGIYVRDTNGQTLFTLYNEAVGRSFTVQRGKGRFECTVDRLPLLPGRYLLEAHVGIPHSTLDRVTVGSIDVVEGDFFGSGRTLARNKHGYFLVPHSWRHDEDG